MTNAEFRARIAALASLDDLDLDRIDDEWVSLSVHTPESSDKIYIHRREAFVNDDIIIEFISEGLTLGNLPPRLLHSMGREYLERNAYTIFACWAYGIDARGYHTLRAVSRINARQLDQQRFRRSVGALLTECSFLRERSAADGRPVIRPLDADPAWRKTV